MLPLSKPKVGCEKRFYEIFDLLKKNQFEKQSFFNKLVKGKKPSKEELWAELYLIEIKSYETIRAPKVGRDKEADDWLIIKFNEHDVKPDFTEFSLQYNDYYVIELAKELDGVPVYISIQEDENVFRGQFLLDCEGLIEEDLIYEAWETKDAMETLDYGNRLMSVADEIAEKHGLLYLKTQRLPPDELDDSIEEDGLESQLHIIYSLARWLIFYGKNGHGYEAYF